MTAINENGQVYFTFEELDLEGARLEVVLELNYLRDERDKLDLYDFEGWDLFSNRISLLMNINLYLLRLSLGLKIKGSFY